jgi:AbrB family looped-hinge helix DNA binding protein
MPQLTVSTKGQIVLPAEIRRRLGMGPGAKLEIIESSNGIVLRVARAASSPDVAALAGLLKAPSKGRPRRLLDFDAASMLARPPAKP